MLGLACMAVPAQPQPGPANIAAAQARRDKAFADYTRLTTTGGAGDPQQALAEYRVAVQALEALKAQAAAPPAGATPAAPATATEAPAPVSAAPAAQSPPLYAGRAPAGCTSEDKFPASDRVDGFGGLGIEYTITGMLLGELEDHHRVVAGFPSARQVTVSMTVHGPYSIEGSWDTSGGVTLDGQELERFRAPNQGGAKGWSLALKPVVVEITENIRRNGFTIGASVGYARSSNAEIVMLTVKGKGCAEASAGAGVATASLPGADASGGGASTPDAGDEALPWELAGAGATALAAAVFVIRALARRRNAAVTAGRSAPGPDEDEGEAPGKQEPESPAGYVLQLSADTLQVQPSAAVTLQATVWRVNQGQGMQIASDAVIRITVPAQAGYLNVTPANGQGQLRATVSLTQTPTQAEVALLVEANTHEGGKSASVRVRCEPGFAAYVNGAKQAPVRYDARARAWRFFDVVAGFWFDQAASPVKPGFPVVFANPAFVAVPDILVLGEAYSGDGGLTHTLRFSLKPGVDLEEVFGPDLYTRHDGQVRVTIRAQDASGQLQQDDVVFRITPQLTLVAHSVDAQTQGVGFHTYLELKLDDLEFIADGTDTLPLALAFVRTDQPLDAAHPFAAAQDGVAIQQITWVAGGTGFDEPRPDLARTRAGVLAYTVRSNDTLDADADALGRARSLLISPRLLPGGASRHCEFDRNDYVLHLKPQFLKLQLWVLPGRCVHTSEALAYVSAMPSRKPVPGQQLILTVDNPAQATLLVESDVQQRTATKTSPPNSLQTILVPGSAGWTLRYSGLHWDTLPQAVFEVRCELIGVLGPVCSVSDTINVEENVRQLLHDLLHDPALASSLNNPEFRRPGIPAMLPLHLRGPAWNAATFFDRDNPYRCSGMRASLMKWMSDRRYHPKAASASAIALAHSMNGIEIEYESVFLVHVWATIFLSGSRRKSDAKAIDPWWNQTWKDPSYASHEGLMTWVHEEARLVALYTELMAMLVPLGMAVGTLRGWELPAAMKLVQLYLGGLAVVGTGVHAAGTVPDSSYYREDGQSLDYRVDWFEHFIAKLQSSTNPP